MSRKVSLGSSVEQFRKSGHMRFEREKQASSENLARQETFVENQALACHTMHKENRDEDCNSRQLETGVRFEHDIRG